ncbi:MAG: YCF48-related protein [Bacteroidetes bacterium]|nr:YCF48-related protein [Bacteroidota bacterium]
MRNLYSIIKILLLTFLPLASYSQSWNKVSTIPPPYNSNYWLDVFFLPSNPDYGWICGYRGQVIRTSDRGKTWAGAIVPFADHLESIHFTSPTVGYTSGVQGIFKSTNGGASWRDITPPNAFTLWGCYFLNDNYGITAGEGCQGTQKFFLTTNGGANWTLFIDSVPNSGMTDIMLYPSGLGYGASSGKIWITNDSGATWSVYLTSGANIWQEEITNIGPSFLVPVAGTSCSGQGNSGGMHFTTNDGASWNSFSTLYPMFGTFLISQNTGWACGFNREVYYTSNGGQTWLIRNCGIDNGNLDDLWFITPNEGWVVGEGVYYLGPDRQDVTRLNMVFGDVCLPGSKYDTLWVKNHSFNNAVMVATNLYGVNFEDFNIVYPPGGFPVTACDSQMVIVQFKPLNAADNKNAKLDINVIGGNNFTIDLLGNGKNMTTVPEDSLLEINPAYCGMTTVDSLKWTASSPDNKIISIQKIEGSYEIVSESPPPINVYTIGVYTYFSASPSDTGLFTSRFKFTISPCSKDTIITVTAYGVSPIITAEDRILFNLNCKLSELDTIPVYNTGNSELIISDYYFNTTNTAFAYIGWTSGRTLPLTVNPLEADSLIIKYEPPISGSHSAVLYLINNDSTSIRGRKNPFYISFNGIVTSTDIKPKDTVLNLNDICLGDSTILNVPMKNKGDLTAIVQNPIYDNTVYRISVQGKSFPFQMKTNDSVNCRIAFKPVTARQYSDTIYIYTLPCNEIMRIVINANCVDSYITAEPDSITGVIQTGLPLRKTVTVHAFGNIPMSITDIKFNPLRPDWTVTASPALPYNINAGDSVDFTIDFTSTRDTILNSRLVFRLDSYCPMETGLPVNISSHSVWLLTSADSIGFGYSKCTAGIIYDTLTITNSGSLEDTLINLEIQPPVIPFNIVNMPALPHILPSGAVEEYIIAFDSSVEGIFTGKLVIDTKNLRGLPINLPLSGEFRKVLTTPDAVNFDYSNVEPCNDTIIKTFYIKNTGTIADSLTISRTENQLGFEIIPSANLAIPSGDSSLISVLLIPSMFSVEGTFSEKFILNSTVCPNTHTVDASVNIIKPRLTIDPMKLDFGNVWIDDSLLKYIDIRNESNINKSVTNLAIIPSSLQFKFNAKFPLNLAPNDFVRIPLIFTSRTEGKEQCRFELIEESICIDTSYVELTGNVPPEVYNTSVKIGNYRAEPGDTITIEVELLDEIPRVKPDRLDFALSFDKMLFYPLRVLAKFRNSRQPVNYKYYPDTLKMSIDKQYSELLFQESGNIIFIEGMVLKYYPDSTGLFITKFNPVTNKVVNVSKIDGSLKALNICPATGGLLIELVNNLKLSLDETVISTGHLKIEVLIPEEQAITIEIWDMMGNRVHNEKIIIKNDSRSFDIDVSNLSNGAYILTIKSDKYYSARNKFIIIR